MILRFAAAFALVISLNTQAFAFCVLGWGTSCLPDEQTALRFINRQLASAPQPYFPATSTIRLGRITLIQGMGRSILLKSIDNARIIVEQIAAAIDRGESCDAIVDKIDFLHSLYGYYRPAAERSKPQFIAECKIIQTLHRKGLLRDISADIVVGPVSEGLYQNQQHLFNISSKEAPNLGRIKMAIPSRHEVGILVSTFGEASIIKKYSQQTFGATIATIEFVAPIIENEYAEECRRLNFECGNAGNQAVGALEFVQRSDGWAIRPDSFRFLRQ